MTTETVQIEGVEDFTVHAVGRSRGFYVFLRWCPPEGGVSHGMDFNEVPWYWNVYREEPHNVGAVIGAAGLAPRRADAVAEVLKFIETQEQA